MLYKKEEWITLALACQAQFDTAIRNVLALEPLEGEKRELENILNQSYQTTQILVDKLKSSDLSEEEKIANATAKAKALIGKRVEDLEAESPYLSDEDEFDGTDDLDDEEEEEDETDEDGEEDDLYW